MSTEDILEALYSLAEEVEGEVKEEIKLKLNELESILSPAQPCLGQPRSPLWDKLRKDFLRDNPTCAACCGKDDLQVHHIQPFHIFPELELERANLITLCNKPWHRCHFIFGHLMNWSYYNTEVISHVEKFRKERNFQKAKLYATELNGKVFEDLY